MKGLFVCVVFMVFAVSVPIKGIEPEPDWTCRFQDLKREALSQFVPPKTGDQITLIRRIGGDIRGRLEGLGMNAVIVDGKTFPASSLTSETCERLFADIFATKTATGRIQSERQAYLDRKTAVEKALQEDQRRTELQKQKDQEEANRAEQTRIEAEEKMHLDFKGLRLGMTYGQVEALIRSSEWAYTFNLDANKRQQSVFLTGKSNASIGFLTIGSEGPDDQKTFYRWRCAFVQFREGRIYGIDVGSPKWSADYIDSSLKDWLRMAYKALVNKYGKPTEIVRSIDQVNIFTFKTGYSVFLYKWIAPDQRIVLSIGEDESKFSATIGFLDLKTQRKMDKESKTETNL